MEIKASIEQYYTYMKRKIQKRRVNKVHEQVKALEAVTTELPTDVEIIARLQNKKGKKRKPG
ncbi:MAG TPA: hypothetical protein VF884_09945 [Nitrososphaeraceae archaeon]